MTQPPDEPDESWQPPGPSPRPFRQAGPSYVQNPYGGGTTNDYQPIDPGGMSSSVKVVLSVGIGVFAGFLLWFVAVVGFASSSTDGASGYLFLAAVAPLVVPASLLTWRATRPGAAGLLAGTAVASIGMSSLCSAVLNGYHGGAQ